MSKEKRPIALLDSGVGGLTVASEIVKFLPGEELVYFGDTLHLPYGDKSREEVRSYVFKIMEYLLQEKNARAVVLACNTASAYLLEEAQATFSLPIFGTIDGACRKAVEVSKNNRIGVIGTNGTINSWSYQDKLLEINSSLELFSQPCPRFVELVEEGKLKGEEIEETAHQYLDELKNDCIDVLILGCTHFPYLIPIIQKIMGNEVVLINPAVEVAREVAEVMNKDSKLHLKDGGINQQEFLVSDQKKVSTRFLKKGSSYLQLPSLNFKEKNIFTGGEEK